MLFFRMVNFGQTSRVYAVIDSQPSNQRNVWEKIKFKNAKAK